MNENLDTRLHAERAAIVISCFVLATGIALTLVFVWFALHGHASWLMFGSAANMLSLGFLVEWNRRAGVRIARNQGAAQAYRQSLHSLKWAQPFLNLIAWLLLLVGTASIIAAFYLNVDRGLFLVIGACGVGTGSLVRWVPRSAIRKTERRLATLSGEEVG